MTAWSSDNAPSIVGCWNLPRQCVIEAYQDWKLSHIRHGASTWKSSFTFQGLNEDVQFLGMHQEGSNQRRPKGCTPFRLSCSVPLVDNFRAPTPPLPPRRHLLSIICNDSTHACRAEDAKCAPAAQMHPDRASSQLLTRSSNLRLRSSRIAQNQIMPSRDCIFTITKWCRLPKISRFRRAENMKLRM